MNGRPSGTVRYDNTGRVVLVSGGASGIGAAICHSFSESGAQVVCMDVREIEDEKLARLCLKRGLTLSGKAANPGKNDLPPKGQTPFQTEPSVVTFMKGDTSSEASCEEVVTGVIERFGGIDVLVNNAAIQPPDSYVALDQLELQSWQRMLDINFTGYTLLAKHAVRQMKRQGAGVIVNMASGQGHRTAREVPCYGPIKAGTIMQAMQWGVQYARDGIRVVSVSPGAIRTPLVVASLQQQGGEKELANRHPVGRLGEPQEVAAAVLWLASPAASFVTATDLQVDGGLGAFGAFAEPYPM